jgi:hypothetical protein
MGIDRSKYEAGWLQAFDYVESVVGGSILAVEQQTRWRSAFYLDLTMPDGDITSVFFRGGRNEDVGGLQIKHEYRMLCALEKIGIEVPHIYGFCEEPAGIVMAKVPGKFDLLKNAESPAEVESVMRHYMEIMARLHQTPIDEFLAIGIPELSTREELAWGDTSGAVAGFRQHQGRPEPGLDFVLDWLARNLPEPSRHVSFVFGDSGQFLFDQGKITAVIDVELGYIGDPAADLGGLFTRDVSEPLGDLAQAIDHYEHCMGYPVNRRAVMYHAIRWGLNTPLYIANMVAKPPKTLEYIQYLGWFVVYQRTPLQQIAYMENVELSEPELPGEIPTPYSPAHDALLDRLQAFKTNSDAQSYDLDRMIRIEEYLRRADTYGKEIERLDCDDVEKLLGKRPAGWEQSEQLLVDFVAANTGESDAELIRFFYRRIKRQEFLLDPVLREMKDATIQMLPLWCGGRST